MQASREVFVSVSFTQLVMALMIFKNVTLAFLFSLSSGVGVNGGDFKVAS